MKQNKKHKKVRIQDIANVLNISTSSVSRALNNHPRISQKTKNRVQQVATELGFLPSLPELMRPDKAEAIIILIPDLEDEFYRKIVAGISERLNEDNYQSFIVDIKNNNRDIQSILKTYQKYGVSGIIHVIGDKNIPKEHYNYLIKNSLPIVTIFKAEDELQISSIIPDIYEGIFKIIHHFKLNNIQKIALVLEQKNNAYDYQISSSFEFAIEEHDLNPQILSVFYINGDDNIERKKLVKEFLIKLNPQAIFVKNHNLAIEIRLIIEEMGLSIPNDVLLIYSGTNTNNPCFSNNLSFLKIPAKKMGYESGEMLLEQISNPNIERKTSVIPVNFILKGSTIIVK